MANSRYAKHPKYQKCCKHPKSSFSRANIRYAKHPKNQKVMQTSENQLYQGEQPICQHPKNQKVLQTCKNQKTALLGQTSDMSNIRKFKKCCKHPKTSFNRANIRYVKHPKNQKVLQTCENQLYQGKHPICQTSEKPKSAAKKRKPENSFTRANIRYVDHPKIRKVLQTSENQLYQGEHPICQTSEKPKSAANMRKPALPGQTSDMSNIRKTKKCFKKAKTSLTRANI